MHRQDEFSNAESSRVAEIEFQGPVIKRKSSFEESFRKYYEMDVTLVSQDLFGALCANNIDILIFISFLNCNNAGQGKFCLII